MPRKIYLCSLFIIFVFGISAQNVISPVWTKSKVSPVGGNAEGWGVDVDASGNVYWPANVDSLGQGLDIICYKYDENGNDLWDTPLFFGGGGAQQSYICNAKSDDALYIGGRYCSFWGFSCDMQLLKVDKNDGQLIWDRTLDFGHNGYDEVDGIAIREDGIYCSGWAQAIQSGAYQNEIGLWKLDFDGNTEWSNSFGEPETSEHQDGHIIVDDNYIYAAGLWNGSGLANLYNGYAFLGKFSKTDGSFVDSTLFSAQSDNLLDIENALGMTSDGTYLYVTGYSTPVVANDWQIFIAKFDKNLNQIWHRNWGGTDTETARGIAVSNGKIYIAGLTKSPGISSNENADALLLEYDTDGNYLSHYTWGDASDNSFRDIAIYNDAIYLSGSSGDDVIVSNEVPSNVAFLIKVNLNEITSVEPIAQETSQRINIYPNPLINTTTIQILDFEQGNYDFQLYDLYGRTIFQTKMNSSQKTMELDFPAGVYYYNLVGEKGKGTVGKIMIR